MTVLGSAQLFTAPLGLVIRHNWFKALPVGWVGLLPWADGQDLRFEQEMQDILLQRLHQSFWAAGCEVSFAG